MMEPFKNCRNDVFVVFLALEKGLQVEYSMAYLPNKEMFVSCKKGACEECRISFSL